MDDDTKSDAAKASEAEPRAKAAARKSAAIWANEKSVPEWLVRGAEAIATQVARAATRDGAPIPEFRTTEMTEVEFDAAIERAR